MMHISDDITVKEQDITERFVRAAGPGGKNVSRDATAVELRVDLAKLSLPVDVEARLIELAGRHVTKDGVLVITARADESQVRNRHAARAQLEELLTQAAGVPRARRTTGLSKAVRDDRRSEKQQHRALKRARRSSGDNI